MHSCRTPREHAKPPDTRYYLWFFSVKSKKALPSQRWMDFVLRYRKVLIQSILCSGSDAGGFVVVASHKELGTQVELFVFQKATNVSDPERMHFWRASSMDDVCKSLCVYVCEYVYVYIYIYIYIYICTNHTCERPYIQTCTLTCTAKDHIYFAQASKHRAYIHDCSFRIIDSNLHAICTHTSTYMHAYTQIIHTYLKIIHAYVCIHTYTSYTF